MEWISIIAEVLPVVMLGKDFIGSYQHCVPIGGLKEIFFKVSHKPAQNMLLSPEFIYPFTGAVLSLTNFKTFSKNRGGDR